MSTASRLSYGQTAQKERFVAMPDERRIDVADNGDFHFPPGTVLVKHFKFEERYHETRLLIRHDDGAGPATPTSGTKSRRTLLSWM